MNQAFDILVVGGGMASARLCAQFANYATDQKLAVVCAESTVGYNRVLLPQFLVGDCDDGELLDQNAPWRSSEKISVIAGRTVVSTDLKTRTAVLDNGQLLGFQKLVFATGSKPLVPPALTEFGYGLRSYSDALELRARLKFDSRVLVVGGGYLGLEIADALNTGQRQIHLLHRGTRLLGRCLDEKASDLLTSSLTEQGIRVQLETSVVDVERLDQGYRVVLGSGDSIEVDAVAYAIGVAPNDRIASEAGVACADGVLTDEYLCTNITDVYAFGECANVAGNVQQLVEPISSQAEALACTLMGERTKVSPTVTNARLKMRTIQLFTAGEQDEFVETVMTVTDSASGIYRTLSFAHEKLTSAILFGDTRGSRKITECIGMCIPEPDGEALLFGNVG